MTAKSKTKPEEKGTEGNEEPKEPLTPVVPEEGTEKGDPTLKKEPKADKLPAEPVDYKQKFSDSSREAQRLLDEGKLKDKRISELEVQVVRLETTAPPTVEELKTKYPDWDTLAPSEQNARKREIERDKRLIMVEKQLAWDRDFKSLLKKPEFDSLKGREDEFKDFSYNHPEVKDLKLLAQSFLFEKGIKVEEPEPIKRKGLLKPTKGPVEIPTSGELTLEQIKILRKEQPKRYIQMIREGKLKKIPEK